MGTTESKPSISPQDIVKQCIHDEQLPLSAEEAANLSATLAVAKQNMDKLVDKLYKKALAAFQKQKTRKIVIKHTYIPMENIQYIEKQLDTLFCTNHNIRIEDMFVY